MNKQDLPFDNKYLWSSFKNGDNRAFESLYNIYSTTLLQYGIRYCSNSYIVEDALQDLFMELWNSKENLADVKQIKCYLTNALRYKILAILKKRKRIAFDHYQEDSFEIFELEMKESIYHQQRVIMEVIDELPPRQKEVVYLHYFKKYSNQKIADLLNINYQSVSNLLHRSVIKIRKRLIVCNHKHKSRIEYYLPNY